MKDYYRILGTDSNATQDDLKKAYRRLALKCHPDRNPDDKEAEERFKEINEAYTCLCDPQKRMNYDRFGAAGAPSFEGFTGGFGDIFENIFGDFFGDAFSGRASGRARGSDLRFDLNITLEEAASGTEKSINIPRWQGCVKCGGSGSKDKGPSVCPACKGAGHVRFQQGFFSVSRTCSRCHGQGSIITDPCEACGGLGKVKNYRDITVKVPAGVDTDTRLKIAGEGESGVRGGPAGDLYIVTGVEEHPFFKREGMNLYCKAPLSFPQAALGAEIEVRTIDGSHKLRIPPGTQPGEGFRLKGMGMPRPGSRHKGDQIVIVNIAVPKHLNQRQRELLEELAKTAGMQGDTDSKGLKKKLKDIFTGAGTQ
ncbi:MAG: molecular chaperone DnaJ [Thermodesulfovibrionales bacterium]|nr:molecular chaperone DnaJ [Thermodesulfovibrionales bacterium]